MFGLRPTALAALAAVALAAPAGAQSPIPEGAAPEPQFQGSAHVPKPISAPDPPRHPFMAPNGRSNLHDDAYQTDTYQGYGPLGRKIARNSSSFTSVCGSVTFDTRGRIVTVCVGFAGPTLRMLDPVTMAPLAQFSLPPRDPQTGNPFTSFGGGGYFYLDHRDRAVIPTTSRHILVVAALDPPGFRQDADYDVTAHVPNGDSIISALPDWAGRIWFASRDGVVGIIDPATGAVRSKQFEPIGNSFAVDSDGSVSIVTDAALYRMQAGADGTPEVVWREVYENDGTTKSGQTQAGSGTTPTLLGTDFVAITDNADPINVVVYQRGVRADGERMVCKQPVFERGASSTDQSLIGVNRSLIVENNHGYSSPAAVELGATTKPGLARVDLDADGRGCRLVWTSQETAPSVVPKLSLAAGLVYTYTKDARGDGQDPWWLTAIDFETGKTVWDAFAGEGLGFNNNYAPVTLGPDGVAYVGVLGGIVRLADGEPLPPLPTATAHKKPRLRLRCLPGGRVEARLVLKGARRVVFRAGRRRAVDRRAPFVARLPRARRITAVVTRGPRKTFTRRLSCS